MLVNLQFMIPKGKQSSQMCGAHLHLVPKRKRHTEIYIAPTSPTV